MSKYHHDSLYRESTLQIISDNAEKDEERKEAIIYFGCCIFMDYKDTSSHTFILIPKENLILNYVRSSEMHSSCKMWLHLH